MKANAIQLQSGKRAKKRHFNGNQFAKKQKPATQVSDTAVNMNDYSKNSVNKHESDFSDSSIISDTVEPLVKSASKKKLPNCDIPSEENISTTKGYLIVDKNILFPFLENNLCCKICSGNIKLTDTQKKGLSSSIVVYCEKCTNKVSTRNSKLMGNKKKHSRNQSKDYICNALHWAGFRTLKNILWDNGFVSPCIPKTVRQNLRENKFGIKRNCYKEHEKRHCRRS